MSDYSYLPQFPIHISTTLLPVNILLKYKKHFAKVLISAFFFKIIALCKLFLFSSGNLLYNFMPIFKTVLL